MAQETNQLTHLADLQFIDRVFSDDNFPKHPRVETSRDKNDKPIYRFVIPKYEFYVEDKTAYANFNNSEGKAMRWKFYYSIFNLDEYYTKHNLPLKGNFEMLIVGTEFV